MFHDTPFFFLRTLWGAMRHANWEEAAERGPLALVVEFFRALFGFSAWPFFIPIESEWRPSAIRQILGAHGIDNWGWGRHDGEHFFQVKLRQASWAQYLLQQHGVPISGQLLDEAGRSAYRPGPRRSSRPYAGATHVARDAVPATTVHATTVHAAKAESTASSFHDPVGQINRAVDRLAKW